MYGHDDMYGYDDDGDQSNYYNSDYEEFVPSDSTENVEEPGAEDCTSDNGAIDLPKTTPNFGHKSTQFDKMCSALNTLRTRGNSCDVLLVCEDKKLPAHRLVLRAGSAYFEAMFSSGMQEASSFEVQFPTIPAKLMSLILDFIYIQRVNVEILPVDEIWEFLSAAHLFELYPLVEICVGELTKKINFGNWALMLQAGRRYLSERLVLSVVQYLVHHDLTKDSDLLELDFDCVDALIATSADKNLHSTDSLINIILSWVNHDENNRKQHLTKLFSSIDFTSASKEIITSLIHENNLVKNSIEISHHLLTKLSPTFTGSLIPKTASTNPKLLFFKSSSVCSFDIKKGEWSTHNLPVNLEVSSNTPTAVSDDAVYFTTTFSPGYHGYNDVHILAFYPHDNRVNAFAERLKRLKFGMVFLKDDLYFTGGIDKINGEKSLYLEKLEIKSRKWRYLAKPFLHRNNPKIIALNENLYVFGGFENGSGWYDESESAEIRIVEKYSPITNQWTIVTVVPDFYSRGFTVAMCFSKIYVGTADTLFNSTLFEFDPDKNCWKMMKDFKPEVEGVSNWRLCGSGKQLPFLVVEESKKYFRVDPRTEKTVFIAEKIDEGDDDLDVEETENFGTMVVFA